jgi:AcrR family transcriptional regulator
VGGATLVEGGGRAQRKAATRQRLLDAAVEVFTSGSAMSTSVDAVAAAASVSKATLFFHFGSRLELLEAVAGQVYAAGTAWQTTEPGLGPFLDRYFGAQHEPSTRMLWEIGDLLSVEGRGAPNVAYRHLTGHLAERLEEDGVEPRRAASLAGVLAPAVLLVARRIAFDQADADEVARFHADLELLLHPHRRTDGSR